MRPSLSSRERDVLTQLARGATYADIAETLCVSENTVKTHVSSLYSKLAVSRRSQALAVAVACTFSDDEQSPRNRSAGVMRRPAS